MEAWMPDVIATNKLRGFVQDNNGEVIESVPGRIRMRIGAGATQGALAWLGLGRKCVVDVELRLERNNPHQQNLLHITVLMSSPNRRSNDATWRDRCGEVFCELRSYLAGAVIAG
jgi:serine/threonine-protein kinase